ncbi:MAG: hypothetical protein K2Y35_20140 [Burkholderiales bacterium]|nr:hypothetical protein [Burkholderiales bacterium]
MKLITIISASALGLALCGGAYAQSDQNQGTQSQQPPAAGQQNPAGDSQRDKDYQAELRKCDSATDRQKCIDAARKKFNQM